METILVAIDINKNFQAVMSQARKYAKALGANVVLVDLEPLLPGAEGADIREDYPEEIRTIHELGVELTAAGIDNRVLLIEGTAADQLVKEVERENPSLIIIGSEPHGALVEALTHGLREQLARRVRCPLLLVPMD